jgi:hypothetical protein
MLEYRSIVGSVLSRLGHSQAREGLGQGGIEVGNCLRVLRSGGAQLSQTMRRIAFAPGLTLFSSVAGPYSPAGAPNWRSWRLATGFRRYMRHVKLPKPAGS